VYYDYFGLNAPPFRITPETQLFYGGGRRSLVLDALVYAISQGEGIVKVVGEVGSGKTMLCRMLAEKLPSHIDVIYLANPHLSPDTILQAIALEMNLAVAQQSTLPDRLHLMQALHHALLEKHAAGRHAVALIEEAQGMPLETLEEIRLLSNLETSHHKLLQMVLFGQPELDINLSAPHIRQLKERITHSFDLTPLKHEEIAEYVDFRLRAVGYKGPPLFSVRALKLLTHTAQGLLRRVNILADKALLAAFADSAHSVEAHHMRRAIADSDFLNYERPARYSWALLLLILCIVLLGVGVIFSNTFAPLFQPQPRSAVVLPQDIPQQTQPQNNTQRLQQNAATLPLLQMRLRATRDWLIHAPSEHFTLQVLEVDSDEAEGVERLIAAEDLSAVLEHLYVLRFSRRDTTRWLLLYGDFKQRADALAALHELPPTLQRNQPFVRRLDSVQNKLNVEQ
jgi:MSHA biogenesis protein MshM